ncbi:MAG: azurin [Gammaproteobacteria bacterium]|nr:azurin [Gammaproteobacteria bacterium]
MRWILGTALIASCGFATTAWSQECAATVDSNDQMQFVQKEITVDSSCESFTVTLRHIGSLPVGTMGHNWVLTKTSDYQAVALEGGAKGAPDYLVPDDARVLAATDTIGGGQETSVSFDPSILEVGGDYSYVCTFPGHFALMVGKLIVQ